MAYRSPSTLLAYVDLEFQNGFAFFHLQCQLSQILRNAKASLSLYAINFSVMPSTINMHQM